MQINILQKLMLLLTIKSYSSEQYPMFIGLWLSLHDNPWP